jgi:hypothetical protein
VLISSNKALLVESIANKSSMVVNTQAIRKAAVTSVQMTMKLQGINITAFNTTVNRARFEITIAERYVHLISLRSVVHRFTLLLVSLNISSNKVKIIDVFECPGDSRCGVIGARRRLLSSTSSSTLGVDFTVYSVANAVSGATVTNHFHNSANLAATQASLSAALGMEVTADAPVDLANPPTQNNPTSVLSNFVAAASLAGGLVVVIIIAVLVLVTGTLFFCCKKKDAKVVAL